MILTKRKISILTVVLWILLMIPSTVCGAANPHVSENLNDDVANDDNFTQTVVNEIDLGDYQEKMIIGEKQLLSVTVLPLNIDNPSITYKSSDLDVATVNSLGRITALKMGSTTITVTSGEISASFVLTVEDKEDTSVAVEDIEIGNHEAEVEVGKTITVTGTVLPSDATNSTIIYTSSDIGIATVTSTGEVKGISAGYAKITLSAGEISKSIPIKVKVATTGIEVSESYLIMKKNDTYQLIAKAVPKGSPSDIVYKSADTRIATVSETGLVTAIAPGSTTIIVKNEDMSVGVSVIVNQLVSSDKKQNVDQTSELNIETYQTIVSVDTHTKITSTMLRYFHENKQILRVCGDGYIIEIDGEDIVNYNNELYTDIKLKEQDETMSFYLNEGNDLCGNIKIYLEEPKGQYLYLFNNSKDRYERIKVDSIREIKVSTPGEYMISNQKMYSNKTILLYSVLAGSMVSLLGLAVFVAQKRKYWFW